MAHHIANEAPPTFEGPTTEEKPVVTQAPEQVPQGTEKVQENATPQVEGVESQATSSGEQPRPKKASFYSNERTKVRQLQEELSALRSEMKQALTVRVPQAQALPPAPNPATQGNDDTFWEEFSKTPKEVLKKILMESKPDILNSITDSMKQDQAKSAYLQKEREADEIVKTSEFAKTNPNFDKDLVGIMSDYGIASHYDVDPKGAVEAAIKIYKLSNPKLEKPFAGSAPTKGQMQSLGSGRPPASTDGVDARMEAAKMISELTQDQTLANNPEWNAKWMQVMSQAKAA